ncbi:Membrane protein [Candidatus Terasakiella magnetica]|uniref:Membrane protein n=1 Tax=Candidatus Terasakiella magnetica TaxID=1867952 RepID=A0A1C3RGN6_9PROT|nr:TVP38/TMEM64 family protein [Candidatus Terasakiella magnetica]SCA56453.1 Membrane protein [Candidatus Terasakiella magnetica]
MAALSEMTQTPVEPKKKKAHLLPLFIVAGGIAAFFAMGGVDYLSFETLRDNRQAILDWTQNNYVIAIIAFILAYHVAVMFSLPGAVWLSLTGGFLFGTVEATAYIVVGATAGAVGIFLLARYALYDFFHAKVGKSLNRMEKGFKEDAMSYMLVLRLVPLFPFWLVNLVPALLGVSLRTYVIGTFFGIIPGAFVYASVGSGLGAVFDEGKTPDLGIIFSPDILTPIIGLAALAMVPVLYKKIKNRGKA